MCLCQYVQFHSTSAGFFLCTSHFIFLCPFLYHKRLGSQHSMFTHLVCPIIYLKSFQICFAHLITVNKVSGEFVYSFAQDWEEILYSFFWLTYLFFIFLIFLIFLILKSLILTGVPKHEPPSHRLTYLYLKFFHLKIFIGG